MSTGLVAPDTTDPPAGGERTGQSPRSPVRGGRYLSHRNFAPPWLCRRPVLVASVVTAALHLMFLSRALGSDEGGFAMVARFWGNPGAYLYGPQWVDRPPGLIAVFAAADRLGTYGTRITATVVAVALVLGVAAAAWVLGGRIAAGWSAWAACAFASSVLCSAEQLNGELVAAACVAWSIAFAVTAYRLQAGPLCWVLAAAAGLTAGAAILIKQDFFDAMAFLAVLSMGLGSRRSREPRRPDGFVLAGGAGFAVPVGLTVWWAQDHRGLNALLYATFGSRIHAATVMAHSSPAAPAHRLAQLVVLAFLCGIGVLAIHLAVVHGRRIPRFGVVPLALLAAFAVELAGIVAGANFWPHYLIGLVPTVAIAAGLTARSGLRGSRVTRFVVMLSVLVTLVTAPASAIATQHDPGAPYISARWLAAAARPGDSLVVPYSHANIIDESGMRPAYPFSWSLPIRIRDPRLVLLRRTLAGPHAPIWVLQWDPAEAWGLDPHDRLDPELAAHYRRVAALCGHPVWLHDGQHRRLPPLPARCNPSAG